MFQPDPARAAEAAIGRALYCTDLVLVDKINPNKKYVLSLENGEFVVRNLLAPEDARKPTIKVYNNLEMVSDKSITVNNGIVSVLGTSLSVFRAGFYLGDTGNPPFAAVTKDGIDKASSGGTTFNIQNSGSGTMELQEDGAPVLT